MADSLKNAHVLVTGGAGFIGSHLVERLLREEAQVTVLDDLSSGKIENLDGCIDRIRFIEGDAGDEKILDRILKDVDYVSHQAALRSVPKSVDMPFDYHRVNVTGTLRLFEKARHGKVKRIGYASSSSVYGDRKDFPEREDDPPRPASPYAATKLFGEYYGAIYSRLYGVEVVALRYFNVFGPRQSLENKYAVVVPKFIVSLLADEAPPIFGTGEQERDFTYIDNVVDANILALTTSEIAGEVFNVAGGAPYSIQHLFFTLSKMMGKAIPARYEAPRVGDVGKTCADLTKSKNRLGFHPQIDFYKGLEKTVAWFSAQSRESIA
ncbi:MAG: SDR family oxidoreductase [Candidatus Omnitrophica bacterium]|nr:SDR family oxidoreductase [Candidatus Omnitrophota bacterium]